MGRKSASLPLLEAAPVFAALGDKTRLSIVRRLSEDGPLPIVRLASETSMTRQAVTKHLVTLEHAGLVRSIRSGRERIWELEPKRLADAQRHLEAISAQWDAAIERLRAFVEG
jgi:DNA-binding transcriptional ArsR family regulator